MNTLYCTLMLCVSIYLIDKLHTAGFETAAMLLCFIALAWLFLFGRALDRAITNLPCWIIRRAQRTPYFHIEGYMERFWLFRFVRRGDIQNGQYSLMGARVHHILRSDHLNEFHDHPWPYLTIILRGGYWEVQPVFVDDVFRTERRTWHGPGSLLWRRANSWHRLELPAGETAWTLFCTGPKVQGWGFLVGRRKVPWREYLGVPAGVGED